MFQSCSICSNPKHADIDNALYRRMKLRDIAAQFGVSRSSLSRHGRKCLDRCREYKNGMRGYRTSPAHRKLFTHFGPSCPEEFRNQIPDEVLKNPHLWSILEIHYAPPLVQEPQDSRIPSPDLAYDLAELENQQRNASKLLTVSNSEIATQENNPLE